MKKNAVLIITVLLLTVFMSGCTSIDNNSTINSSSSQNNSNMQSNESVTLQINSNSSWKGTLTYRNGTQVINGDRSATYNLGQSPGKVTVILQKTDNAGTLSVQLIKDGNVVVNQSTSGSQGVISITYSS